MTTRAEVEFGDREVSEVGAKCVDCGFDFLELGGCRGTRIVGYKGGIRKSLRVRGGEGLLNVGGAGGLRLCGMVI